MRAARVYLANVNLTQLSSKLPQYQPRLGHRRIELPCVAYIKTEGSLGKLLEDAWVRYSGLAHFDR
ncbi:MAG: hypothetical protein NVSMB58_36660 [Terriglobales bacterium]